MDRIKSKLANGSPQTVPRLWTPNFILICLVGLCNSMAFQGLNVSLPIYIDKLGYSTSLAGLPLAMLTVAAVIIRPFAGLALDKYGRKMILFSSLIMFLLPSVAYIFMAPFSVLLMLRFVQGFGWGISNTSVGTLASDIVPPVRMGEGMGTFNVTGSISSALAPLITLWLIIQFSSRTLFVVISLVTVASIIFSQAVKYPPFEQPPQKLKLELFDRKALRPALVVMFMAIALSSVISFLALFARGRGISNPGVFFAFMGLSTFFSRPMSGKLLDRLGQRGFDIALIVAVPMMAISLWIVSLTGPAWYLAVSGALFGIGSGSIQSSMLAMLIKMLPGKHGSAIAIFGTFLDTGIALGSILWGVVAVLVGYQVMFRLVIIPVLLCLLVYFIRKPIRQITSYQ